MVKIIDVQPAINLIDDRKSSSNSKPNKWKREKIYFDEDVSNKKLVEFHETFHGDEFVIAEWNEKNFVSYFS